MRMYAQLNVDKHLANLLIFILVGLACHLACRPAKDGRILA